MKIKNTFCLHILMAILAILFLSVPPLVRTADPELTFQPLIKSMEGTPKERKQNMSTISHALQGNAIFFIGASEVSTSEDEHYAVYNYFNNQLHRPLVAYGDSYVDSITHFLLLSRFKNDINANSKIVLMLAPDTFYSEGIPPAIFANNFPSSVFNPLMKDMLARPLLVKYLRNIDQEDISHLTFSQMEIYGWYPDIIWQEVSYLFANFCEMVKNEWLAMLNITPQPAKPWPEQPVNIINPDWDMALAHARELNKSRQQSADTMWMDKSIFADDNTPDEWDNAPAIPSQLEALRATVKLLKARNAQFVVVVDPINPWAIKNSEKFQVVDQQIRTMLEQHHVPYFDMYAQPYQNGWNWDRLHPTELAWVAIDRFIAESFKR